MFIVVCLPYGTPKKIRKSTLTQAVKPWTDKDYIVHTSRLKQLGVFKLNITLNQITHENKKQIIKKDFFFKRNFYFSLNKLDGYRLQNKKKA